MGSSWEKGVREEEQGKWNNPVDTKVSEGGLIGAPVTLCNSWRRPWFLPGRTWKNTSEDIHTAACGGPHTRAGESALKEALACVKPTQAAGLNCIPYEGSNIGKMWGRRYGREEVLWTDCNPHFLILLALLGVKGVWKHKSHEQRSKVQPRKKGRCYQFYFCLSASCSIFI